MKKAAIGRIAGFALTACVSAGLVQAAHSPGVNLYFNGGLASSRVIQHNGIAYAPIADMAKALNQTVVTRGDGYAITPAGGANQVNGINGKIGDKLTNGEIVFSVVKVFRTDKYTFQFTTGELAADNPKNDLVVVVFRAKSARHISGFLSLAGGDNTAITDQDEHSYTPSRFGRDFQSGTPTLLPGSAVDWAMCFIVPKNQKIGDLVYDIYGSGYKSGTFRVSLASANP